MEMDSANPVDSAQMRRLNSRSVLQALRSAAAPTLTQLATQTGLSRHTAAGVLSDLASRGLAEELAPAEGSSGRPARRFRFRSDAGYVVGFAFAPDHVMVMVADLDGTEVARQRCVVDPAESAAGRLRLAEGLAHQCTTGTGPIWAAAAGTTGVVARDGRVTVASQIPGWTGLDLGDRVGGWFGCPGLAGNDAHLAALAEQWRGNARYVEDVAYLLTGHRSGFGLVIDGRVHPGRSGSAGELGKLRHLLENDPTDLLAAEGVTAEVLFARARDGDERALAVADRIAYGLAQCAAVLSMAIDPEVVVLGGDLARNNHTLVTAVRQHLAVMCLNPPEVVLSGLGEETVALGAVRAALNRIEDSAMLFGSQQPAVTQAG